VRAATDLGFFAPARFALLDCKTPKTVAAHWRADFASMSPLRAAGFRGHIVFSYHNSTAESRATSFNARELPFDCTARCAPSIYCSCLRSRLTVLAPRTASASRLHASKSSGQADVRRNGMEQISETVTPTDLILTSIRFVEFHCPKRVGDLAECFQNPMPHQLLKSDTAI